MKLSLNKTQFTANVLGPTSKISDNLLLNFYEENGATFAKTMSNSADNSTILLANIPCKCDVLNSIIIPDCKTFLRLFSGIEAEDIVLNIDSNSICYKNKNFSFKYHLLDESYLVHRKSISEEKLNNLAFDTEFNISKQTLSDITKYNSIVPDAEKLYFSTRNDGAILAKLGDEQKSNTNEIELELAASHTGKQLAESLPINVQNLLLFSFNSDTITISINQTLKIFKFEIPSLKYIVSGLVK